MAAHISRQCLLSSVGDRIKHFFAGDKCDLQSELKQCIFKTGNVPVVISEDPALFARLMSNFQNYEKSPKSGAHHAVLKKLVKSILKGQVSFEKDFPFYIVLAQRIFYNFVIYGGDDASAFINLCIEKMEGIDPSLLSLTLNKFVERGDFPIMPDTYVFEVLEAACLDFATLSTKLHKGKFKDKLPEHYVYTRIVWVSAALKCQSRYRPVARATKDVWIEHLVKMCKEVSFTPDVIDDIRRGLNLIKLLNLPPEVQLGSEVLALFATENGKLRPFSHIMNFIDVASQSLSDTDVIYLVISVRVAYELSIKECHPNMLSFLSLEQTLSGAIQEGVTWLEKLRDILSKMEQIKDICDHELLRWLIILLSLVDVTQSHAEVHLHFSKLLTGESPVVRDISKKLVEKTKDFSIQLPIHVFFLLYKDFKIWSNQFLEDYLNAYKVSSGVKICDGTWDVFFAEITHRFPGAHNHQFLLGLIMKIGDCYRRDGRPLDFILDMLQMKVPKLLALPTDTDQQPSVEIQQSFCAFVQEYILQNDLKGLLLTQMTDIFLSTPEQPNDLQLLILDVFQKNGLLSSPLPGTASIKKVLQNQCSELEKQNTALSMHNTAFKAAVSDLQQERLAEREKFALTEEKAQSRLSNLERELREKISQLDSLSKELSKLKEQEKLPNEHPFWQIHHNDVKLLEKELGRGSWGRVVEGLFRGQKVAVKCVHEAILQSTTVQRVHREISTMAAVRHPNLVLFVGAVLDGQGGPMIVTELLDMSLRMAYETKLLRPGLDGCLSILLDVASALCYLHELQTPIIHRDVSSANILLEAKGNDHWKAKLSDFGSANWAKHAKTMGDGAAVYSAPESFPVHFTRTHKPQTTKMDVYSYGILLCEAVLHKFPDPETLQATLAEIKAEYNSLYALASTCLCEDPEDRPMMSVVINKLNSITNN